LKKEYKKGVQQQKINTKWCGSNMALGIGPQMAVELSHKKKGHSQEWNCVIVLVNYSGACLNRRPKQHNELGQSIRVGMVQHLRQRRSKKVLRRERRYHEIA
jgi:hypothetical protein